MPPAQLQVTDGDYVLSGGLTVHLADQAGLCGPESLGNEQFFVANLNTDDGAQQALVEVSVRPAHLTAAQTVAVKSVPSFSSGPPPYTGTFGLSRSTVLVQTGVTSTTGQLDPKARTFVATSLTVTVRPNSTGSVTAVLHEQKLGGSATGLTTFTPIPDSPAVNLTGTFSCIAPPS